MSSSNRRKTNIELLTEQQKYVQKARKAKSEQVERVDFDDDARREWLSGFSKRKKAKTEERRARAKERDRIAHRDERREARNELKKKAAENVRNVRIAMGLDPVPGQEASTDSDSDSDSDDSSGAEAPREDAYEDDVQIATVTITEDFDPAESRATVGSSRQGLSPTPDVDAEDRGEGSSGRRVAGDGSSKKRKPVGLPEMPASSRRAQKKAKASHGATAAGGRHERSEKQSRGMETKAERKFGRAMDAKRRSKKAHVALERDGRYRGTAAEKGRHKARESKGKGGPGGKGKRR